MGSPHHDLPFGNRGMMFWLPPHGFGNGIDASNWAELADLPEHEVAPVMFDLAAAKIAAYVAVPRHPRPDSAKVRYRLWVDSLHYRRAEDLLMEILATLHHKRPPTPRAHGDHCATTGRTDTTSGPAPDDHRRHERFTINWRRRR